MTGNGFWFFQRDSVVLKLSREKLNKKMREVCPKQEDIKMYIVLGITTYPQEDTIEVKTCYNDEVGLMYIKGKNDIIDETDNIRIDSNKERLIRNLELLINDQPDLSKLPEGVRDTSKVMSSYSEPKEPEFSNRYGEVLGCCG